MSDSAARSSLPSEIPYLSPAEWRVFSVVSKKGRPLTIRQLVTELATTSVSTRSYTTILTLAQRLVAKGYLTESEKAASHGPASAISYSAAVPYDEALRRHTERFLAQFAFSDRDDLLLVSAVVAKQLADS